MAQSELFKYFGSFIFPNIFRTFRISIQPSRLITAFMAVLIIFLAGTIMDFGKTVVVSGRSDVEQLRSQSLAGGLIYPSELHCYVNSPGKTGMFINKYKDHSDGAGVFYVLSNYCMGRFNDAAVGMTQMRFDIVISSAVSCVVAAGWAISYHTWYSIIILIIAIVCLSIFGGAICRGAALQFSRGEKPGIVECLRFSIRKFISLVAAPLAPVILVATFGFFIFLLGVLTNIPWAGEIIMAVLFIFVLLVGVLMTFAVMGSAAGVGLMGPVIAYENSDTFDAISKSFSYVFSQPWRMVFYTFLGVAYGAVSYLFVRLFAFVLLVLSRWFLVMGVWVDGAGGDSVSKISVIWPEPEFFNLTGTGVGIARSGCESVAAFIVELEVLIVAGLVGAFVLSFYFTLNSIIYCLLRKRVDGVAIEDVYTEAQEFAEFCQAEARQDSNQEITGQEGSTDESAAEQNTQQQSDDIQ